MDNPLSLIDRALNIRIKEGLELQPVTEGVFPVPPVESSVISARETALQELVEVGLENKVQLLTKTLGDLAIKDRGHGFDVSVLVVRRLINSPHPPPASVRAVRNLLAGLLPTDISPLQPPFTQGDILMLQDLDEQIAELKETSSPTVKVPQLLLPAAELIEKQYPPEDWTVIESELLAAATFEDKLAILERYKPSPKIDRKYDLLLLFEALNKTTRKDRTEAMIVCNYASRTKNCRVKLNFLCDENHVCLLQEAIVDRNWEQIKFYYELPAKTADGRANIACLSSSLHNLYFESFGCNCEWLES